MSGQSPIELNTSPQPTMLINSHIDHLIHEGFTPNAIDRLKTWGVRSITASEAKTLRLTYDNQTPAGLWFPFHNSYGQLRTDDFPLKYLSPSGKSTRPWNSKARVVTEGYKDAAAATLMGNIPTAAIAGVSHYKSLPPLGQTVIFDSDATTNPSVFASLIRAAIYLGGKATSIPQDFGHKAGLVEFFKEFSPTDQPDAYRELLATAMTPLEMLYHLPSQWSELSGKDLDACAIGITSLVRDFPEISGSRRSIEYFCGHVSGCSGYPVERLLARFPKRIIPSVFHRSRPRHKADPSVEIPIEICLAQANQKALAGVSGSRRPTAFRIAADLCGVQRLLERWGQNHSDPWQLLESFGAASEMCGRDVESAWRSAERSSCKPAVPEDKILDRITYWQWKNHWSLD
jgi:hypothetical protein